MHWHSEGVSLNTLFSFACNFLQYQAIRYIYIFFVFAAVQKRTCVMFCSAAAYFCCCLLSGCGCSYAIHLFFLGFDSNILISDLLEGEYFHLSHFTSKTMFHSKAGAWVVGRDSFKIQKDAKVTWEYMAQTNPGVFWNSHHFFYATIWATSHSSLLGQLHSWGLHGLFSAEVEAPLVCILIPL